MEASKQESPLAGLGLTPEQVAQFAEAVLKVAGRSTATAPTTADQTTVAAVADTVKPPLVAETNGIGAAIQTGTAVGESLAMLAEPLTSKFRFRSSHRLASRKLWMSIGTIGGLLAQSPLGIALPLPVQMAIAGLSAVYVIVQGEIDKKESQHGEA